MWDLILNPFITLLTLLYSFLGHNVVLSIVVFTVLVRLAILPLTAQQQRSSKRMQELQPELKKLQEKHKNDREKLAQEQMALYKEHGVNPFGGCFPLLIQFPILIGLYQAIIFTLAATPFQLLDLSGRFLLPGLDHLVPLENLWLGMDLSQPPTNNPTWALALPVLVLVTTWAQSKLTVTPTPASSGSDGRPSQAQAMTQSMTTVMPLMFGFFSLSFSVGLSIYFVISNIIGIIQYSLMGQSKLDLRKLLRRGPTRDPGSQDVDAQLPAASTGTGRRRRRDAGDGKRKVKSRKR
ncbi:MAG: YidC/Oxa1 family membrane protein insertase [Anaerolineaceae bacterium]|nr:YidC/Oxa1 family membrane protein insertase [Anaerolineaceae bacterium]MCY4022713.1 YidC/Oxa1 family membrane protein insertase [Anaerolineaceae bacterium]